MSSTTPAPADRALDLGAEISLRPLTERIAVEWRPCSGTSSQSKGRHVIGALSLRYSDLTDSADSTLGRIRTAVGGVEQRALGY